MAIYGRAARAGTGRVMATGSGRFAERYPRGPAWISSPALPAPSGHAWQRIFPRREEPRAGRVPLSGRRPVEIAAPNSDTFTVLAQRQELDASGFKRPTDGGFFGPARPGAAAGSARGRSAEANHA
jgi:hypothetical protein